MPTEATRQSRGRSSPAIRLALALGAVARSAVPVVAALALMLGWRRIDVMFDERQAGFPAARCSR